MQKISNNSLFHFRKTTQISNSHCGPAVVQMLLGHLAIEITQQEITKAAGASRTIADNGIRIDEMVIAINTLKCDAQLWFKDHASLSDIQTLLLTYGYPVGVQWQGLFTDDEDEINDDTGHYSIVTRVDEERQELIIADPYKDFANQDRIISMRTFLKRWWDENEVRNVLSRKKYTIRDDKLLFVITPKSFVFPSDLSMLPGSLYKECRDKNS